MLVEYKSISKASKVFIYPSNRKLYKDELPVFLDKIEKFLLEFKEVDSFFEIRYSRFIVIFISDQTPLSLEKNDDLVYFIQSLEKEFKLTLLDRVNVCFKQGEYVQLKQIPEFKKLIKNKGVSKRTIVFDNLLNTKDEYDNYWEIPAENSWISHFF